jgi:phenylalanyl-tRNA synthetase beta chain
MTVVEVDYRDLIELLGERLGREEVMAKITAMGAGHEGVVGDTLRLDIFPNRPDMYSVEGIGRALRGYLGLETGLPAYPVHAAPMGFVVDPSTKAVRPHAVGGLVTNVQLTEPLLKSLIDLQEKLHLTLGRKRRKVAIGIHDADAVTPPFAYKAVEPRSVRFVPLDGDGEMDLAEILEGHEKGREYAPILEGMDRYPLIVDAEDRVLSFPPVINGVVTQLTPETRNLFLDVTGTDWEAVNVALNIVATMLAERGGAIHTVEVAYADATHRTPDLTPKERTLDVAYANAWLGLNLTPDETADLLRRMRYDARPEGDVVQVKVPAYRADILHMADLAEDVAVAYGYERFPTTMPKALTLGTPAPLNDFADALRSLMVGYGYQEVMGLTVAPEEEPYGTEEKARIRNPFPKEQRTLRRSLLPSLFQILQLNRHRDLPQRVFEIGDVVVDLTNVRRLAAASIHPKAGFTEMKTLVQSLMRDVGKAMDIAAREDGNFLPGRCAVVLLDGAEVGRFGEAHPRVVTGYALDHPVVVMELDVAPLAT